MPSNHLQADILEVAYAACLLEEQGSWGAAPSSSTQQLSLRTSNPSVRSSSCGISSSGASSHGNSRLPDEALAVMAEKLAQQVLQPQDPAAAATAQLQVSCFLQAGHSAEQCSLIRWRYMQTGITG